MLSPELLGNALVVVVVAGKSLLDLRGGKRRDSTHAGVFRAINAKLDQLGEDVDELRTETSKVSALVIGADGQNGIRGKLREVQARVIDLEDRERDRLSHQQLHGTLDRRSS